MDFYDRIDDELKKHGKTRTDLAKETNISYATIASMFSRKSKRIDLESIRKISEVLHVTADYLILGRVDPYLVNEEGVPFGTLDELEHELLSLFRQTDLRGKTKILSKAYEIDTPDKA